MKILDDLIRQVQEVLRKGALNGCSSCYAASLLLNVEVKSKPNIRLGVTEVGEEMGKLFSKKDY